MASKTRRYWDTACCFGYLNDQAGRGAPCSRVATDVQEGNSEIIISSLTIAEVLHFKGHPRPFDREMRSVIRNFFRRSDLVVADVDRFISELAQDLFWEHDILPKDAIHIATALEGHANYLETFDQPLIDKSRQLGGDPQLVIQLPGADLSRADALKARKAEEERQHKLL